MIVQKGTLPLETIALTAAAALSIGFVLLLAVHYHNSLEVIFGALALLALATYVLVRGDDGFSSGTDMSEWPFRPAPAATFGQVAPDAGKYEPPAPQLSQVAGDHPTTITLGRCLLIVANYTTENETSIAIPLLRLGSAEKPVTARVELIDGSAEHGRDYAAAKVPGKVRGMPHKRGSVWQPSVQQDSTRILPVTFEAGARVAFCYVAVLTRPLRSIHVGHLEGSKEFVARLLDVSVGCASGPVMQTLVRLSSAYAFLPGSGVSSLSGFQNLRKILRVRKQRKERERQASLSQSLDMLLAESTEHAEALSPRQPGTPSKPNTANGGDDAGGGGGGKGASPARFVRKDSMYTQRRREARREGAKRSVRDVGHTVQLLCDFLRSMLRISGLAKKLCWFQISQIWLAVEEVVLQALAYKWLIRYGLEQGDRQMAALLAFGMLALKLIHYRIALNYFHGSFLVCQHLRSELLRKYASLSHLDHYIQPSLEQDYRVALTYTCEEIRVQFWKNLFSNGLPALYKLIASIGFLFFVTPETAHGAWTIFWVTVGTTLFSLAWYSTRVLRGADIWQQQYHLNRESEHTLAILLRSWSITREASTADADSRAVFDGYWKRIRLGDYVMWYHLFYSSWVYQAGCAVALYYLWAMAPVFDDTALFVPLIQVFGLLQANLALCFQALLGVFISASQIREVLWLLNYQSEEVMTSGSRLTDAQRHSAFSSAIDDRCSEFEANARDARTIAPMLTAINRLLSSLPTSADDMTHPSHQASFLGRAPRPALPGHWSAEADVDAMRDLLLYWSPAMTPQPEHAVILRHVSFKNPLTAAPIFTTLELVDERQPDHPSETLGLPFGLVGLRVNQDIKSQQVEETLLSLLRGQLTPDAGTALCLLHSRFVGLKPVYADGTIKSNVRGGCLAEDREFQSVPDDPRVWALCRRVGIDPMLIGYTYSADWGNTHLVADQLTHEQAQKVELARALLTHPDVLLLHRVGDSLSKREQFRLGLLLRDYLSGALHTLLQPHGRRPPPHRHRCVVLNMNDQALAMLLEKEEPVLTVESAAKATLRTRDAVPELRRSAEAYALSDAQAHRQLAAAKSDVEEMHRRIDGTLGTAPEAATLYAHNYKRSNTM